MRAHALSALAAFVAATSCPAAAAPRPPAAAAAKPAQVAPAQVARQLYARRATWAETMVATRANCAAWIAAARPADGATAGTPLPALWAMIAADWREACAWFAEDLPRRRHLDWFLHAADLSFEIHLMRALPAPGAPGADLARELADLRSAKVAPSDPRWLELYARSRRFGAVTKAAPGLWLAELRDALLAQADEMIRARVPSADPRWAALATRAARCADPGPVAHPGALADLREAGALLAAAFPDRFIDRADLASDLAASIPRWTAAIGGAARGDAVAIAKLPALLDEVRAARGSLLRAMRDMPEFLAAWDAIGLGQEWERQFAGLRRDLAAPAHFERVAPETFRRDALILAGDRDPADVIVRRTTALLDDLARARPALAAYRSALDTLRRASVAIAPSNAEARYVLYAEACRLRRQIAFANPLLAFDRLLFLKRHPAIYNHMCDQYYGMTARPGGALCVLEHAFDPEVAARDLLADRAVTRGRLKGQRLSGGPDRDWRLGFDGLGTLSGDETVGGSFLSPDLSYDATRIAFAYVECRGARSHVEHTDPARGHWDPGRCYHIFQVAPDGSGLEQLTDGSWNEFDPCYLPDGRIAFISERRGGYLRCGRICPTYTLHDMAADGTDIRCLSPHETNEWHPSVAHDGRIVWTRWDYVDRHGVVAHMPWTTTPDGRDPRPVHGNYSLRARRPDMELDTRAVPGSRRFIATAAPHHGQSFGSLVMIDPRAPDDDAMGPIKRLTPEIGFPESQDGTVAYGEPWPLSDDYHLCVYDADAGTQQSGGPVGAGLYGIYLLDSFGNRELIYRDARIGCHNPIPLVPRPAPPSIHAPPPAAVAGCGPDEATLAVLDVYDSLKPWPTGTRIQALRVYQILPQTLGSVRLPHTTGIQIPFTVSVNVARKILGTVPVEPDGSAHFVVPARKELFFQALDENGLAVQSMRSATHLQPGESRTCHGCHEPKTNAPVAARPRPAALTRAPSRLRPDVDGTNPFSYPRLVQPVLDRHCVACHEREAGKAPRLDSAPVAIKNGRWYTDGTYYASYISLAERFGFFDYGGHTFDDERAYRTFPGEFGARASKLYPMLVQGHHGVKLTADELHRIAVWLDSTSPFYGVYEPEGGLVQLRGEIAKPTLE